MGIRDGKNSDPGWKKFGFGSRIHNTMLENIYNILGVSDPNWFHGFNANPNSVPDPGF
jgi:hypothetical protein